MSDSLALPFCTMRPPSLLLTLSALCVSVWTLPAWAVGSDMNQTGEKPKNTHAAYANAMGNVPADKASPAAAAPAPEPAQKAKAPAAKRQQQGKTPPAEKK